MNEPKKRGRPTRAEQAAKAALAESMRLDPPPASEDVLEPRPMVSAVVLSAAVDEARERAQAYAMRVWSGQSEGLGRAERIARCERALQGQNLPTEGVKYPGGTDDDEWTAEDAQPVTWRKASA
jgi:hypothetical protein